MIMTEEVTMGIVNILNQNKGLNNQHLRDRLSAPAPQRSAAYLWVCLIDLRNQSASDQSFYRHQRRHSTTLIRFSGNDD